MQENLILGNPHHSNLTLPSVTQCSLISILMLGINYCHMQRGSLGMKLAICCINLMVDDATQ